MDYDMLFSIGELANICGITPKTLRYYDKLGLLKPAYINTTNGYRFYTRWHITRISTIKQLQNIGISLDDIHTFFMQDDETNIVGCLSGLLKHQEKYIAAQLTELEQKQKKIRLLQADMSSYDEMMKFVSRIKEEASHVDWLVNNVGISTYAKYEDYTFDEWTKIVNTNLSVPVFLVKELRPIMSEGGSILFTGSYAGQQAYSSSLVYGVTKSAIHFLTKSLVKELEPKQIRVNAIAPGFIETSWHKNRTPESYERINRKIALHRFGEISEVADMAYEVLKNGYMNGSVVDIHGGYDYF